MKLTQKYRGQLLAQPPAGEQRRKSSSTANLAIATARQALLQAYANQLPRRGQLLHLALNEAEALAWQTDFPHLFFPELAEEKVRRVAAWARKQRAVQGAAGEVAFAA